ncbi:MAG: AAA family ATPase [Desulfopila sp.]|jgi:type II secretory pathway predicted ATPase ExeA|nr:AAA family ATPase [Desulfopila sp.]
MEKKRKKGPRDTTPFQDRINVNVFFSGAQRRKLLDELKKAIADGAAVITVTGEEGTGKTMLCRMVEKELPAETICAYLPNTLESFDDVVRVLALKVGTANADKPESTKTLVAEIGHFLDENDQRLVVLFDQSERMYLATIERIRKMLDRINLKKVLLQIVFVGRKSLLENLEQLSICNFSDAEERHFVLNPLGLSETYAYLNHCAQQRSTGRGKNIFTPEAAKKIYGMAQGNLRMTNMLAAKSLQEADSETSFMVLLDSVSEEKQTPTIQSRLRPILSFFPGGAWTYGGLALVAGILLFFLTQGGEKPEGGEHGTVRETVTVAEVSQEKKTSESTAAPESLTDSSSQKESRDFAKEGQKEKTVMPESRKDTTPEGKIAAKAKLPAGESRSTPASTAKPAAGGVPGEKGKNNDVAEIQDSTAEDQKSQNGPVGGAAEEKTVPSAGAPRLADDEPPQPVEPQVTVSGGSTEQLYGPAVEESGSIAFSPLAVEERSPGGEDRNSERGSDNSQSRGEELDADEAADDFINMETEGEPVILAEIKKRLPPPVTKEVDGAKKIVRIAPAKVKTAILSGDSEEKGEIRQENDVAGDLFQQRAAAGQRWLRGQKEGEYTIQLMALTAERAEDSLKRRLEQREYHDVANQLFILRENPAAVFVFYGEYQDRESARLARNMLPLFLREHEPYVVSVQDAIMKVTAQQ